MPLVCELKYCECCGALMVRRGGSPEDYCAACEQLLLTTSFPMEALRAVLQRRHCRALRPRPAPLPADPSTAMASGRPS